MQAESTAGQATAIENFGKPIFSNTIALGAMAKLLGKDLDKELVIESILAIITKSQEENRRAFELGFDYVSSGV